MLKPAFLYKEQLEKKFLETAYNPKYLFLRCISWFDYECKIKNSSWNSMQMVSIRNQNIIGFFEATINRDAYNIDELFVLNFYDKSFEFSRDFRLFLSDLFIKYQFNKITFSCIIGNPIEKMYDRFVNKYGGRIVGTLTKDCKGFDNMLRDRKIYEVMRENFCKSGGVKCKNFAVPSATKN